MPKPNNEAEAKPELKPHEEPLTQTTEKQTETQGPEKKLLVPKQGSTEIITSLQVPNTEKLMPPEVVQSFNKRKSIKVQQAIRLNPEAIKLNQIIGSSRRQSVMMY